MVRFYAQVKRKITTTFYIINLNPERPIYFYPLAADCHIKCDIIYIGNFGRLKVAGAQNDHL